MMNQKRITVIAVCLLMLLQLQQAAGQDYNVIPRPAKLVPMKGSFELDNKTCVQYTDDKLKELSEYIRGSVHSLTGIDMEKESSAKVVKLVIQPERKGNPEGYQLNVTPTKITITSAAPHGIFYGVQTLLQLIPINGLNKIPCVSIQDEPRFGWRGLMLDVSRHFFTVAEIKKMLDQMALYKFNLLHLHLSDDQGWRLEIKSLPELTTTGAWRVPRTGLWWERDAPREEEAATYGGFYTHEDIKDILEYAAARHIKVLPEIDVPGHSLAAIAAYPHLSSTKLRYKVNPGSKFYTIDDNSLCPGQEATFDFLEKVFTEVAALFPFEYIHIGGDECYKGFWTKCANCQQRMKDNGLKNENELQSYFVKRLEQLLKSKGKKLLGWDEILEGGLAPEATVMSWRGMGGGIEAAKAKHHVVMSPTTHAYLDLYQGDPALVPPTYSMLRLKDVYSFEPVPAGVDDSFILGGQGNLWSESVPTWRHAEYMLWPRSFALSEALWSPSKSRDWNDFIRRIEAHFKRMDLLDINYARSMYDPIIQPSKNDKGILQLQLDTEVPGLDIYYTFDNTYPDRHSAKYSAAEVLKMPDDADTFRVITYRNGEKTGRLLTVALTELEKRVPKK
jgi:hexosaminidase